MFTELSSHNKLHFRVISFSLISGLHTLLKTITFQRIIEVLHGQFTCGNSFEENKNYEKSFLFVCVCVFARKTDVVVTAGHLRRIINI